jgi:3-oxoacyl-[acyl-carrier protein] reductase
MLTRWFESLAWPIDRQMHGDEGVDVSEFGDLTGRRALVTGGSSGIGKAIALELARAGADVLVHYAKSSTAASAVTEEISRLGQRSVTLRADFSFVDQFETFVDEAFQIWGGLDIWIGNAGVDLLTGENATANYSTKLQHLLDVDVRAGMLLAKSAGNRMVQEKGGAILTIGWDQSDRGMEGDSGELFSAAKNAVMGFSRSLAVSLAPAVRVNCIAPGWIKTAWGETASDIWQERVLRETPLRRWGLPEDIARLARFLVSDDAAYITGQVINCNGGAVR